MVHPSAVSDSRSTPVPGTRVVTPELFGKLTATLLQYATALGGAPNRWGEEQAVRDQLAHHHLTADRFFNTYSEPVRRP